MKKDVTLYNVLFPLWMILLLPTVWLVLLPANFLIDSLVLLLAFRLYGLQDRKRLYLQSIFKVWGFGFLADIIGSGLLLLTQLITPNTPERSAFWQWFDDAVVTPVAFNPFASVAGFFVVLIAVAVAGYLIYLFNYKVSLKKWDADDMQKRKTALLLALLTAPYTFFIPTQWLYY